MAVAAAAAAAAKAAENLFANDLSIIVTIKSIQVVDLPYDKRLRAFLKVEHIDRFRDSNMICDSKYSRILDSKMILRRRWT